MSELNKFRLEILSCLLIFFFCNMNNGIARPGKYPQIIGRVGMLGSIIDTPCAIATNDIQQAIDMKITTVGEVLDNGHGQSFPFSIRLVNCVIDPTVSVQSYFSTTFDGPAEDGLFRINGAKGVGLQIVDTDGNIATPGKALPAGAEVNKSQQLNYTMRLVRNRDAIDSGDYHAAIRFKVDYF